MINDVVDISINVSDINNYIKNILENNENLKYLYVKGEISNFKIASNNAAYFTISDEKSSISCVMFSNYVKDLTFSPKNGDQVYIIASISVYTVKGSYSLRVYNMTKKGLGDALIEFEKLKKKLYEEGLFDESRKRSINQYPKKIGIITALNSAAIKDLTYNIHRRYPLTDILIFPSSVQGENASKELIKAFNISKGYDLDTLIIGRGGGSNEDLSAFNDETLIRELAKSTVPIISAVGHEIDLTLLDFLADKKASTPTGAAELACINVEDLKEKLIHIDVLLEQLINKKTLVYQNILDNYQEKIDYLIDNKIYNLNNLIDNYKKRIEDLNPYNILSRGFSITTNSKGDIIKRSEQVNKNDKIITMMNDFTIYSIVEEVNKNNEK